MNVGGRDDPKSKADLGEVVVSVSGSKKVVGEKMGEMVVAEVSKLPASTVGNVLGGSSDSSSSRGVTGGIVVSGSINMGLDRGLNVVEW